MNVSRSGYYDWLNRPITSRAKENKRLTKVIKEICIQNHNIYGICRIADQLAKRNISVSHHRISKLMAAEDLVCKTKRKFKVTAKSNHNSLISPKYVK